MRQNLHFSPRNATRAAMSWAASPVGRLARVEVLVTLSCALLAVLVLLGSGRRASRSASFRLAVWLALMLSYPAVSYTIGLMQSASFRNEFVVVWGCLLLLLVGCADGIAAYSLNDFDQQARTMLNQGLQIVYVLLLLLSYVNSLPFQLRVLLFLLWALSVAKLGMRVRSFLLAGRDRVRTVDNELIADYMSLEHELNKAEYNAATMEGYQYVVAGETDQEGLGGNKVKLNDDVVTVDNVWRCKGKLLGSDDASARKHRDLCLSFALFKLLLRRFGGYPLHESCLNKTRDFVQLGLLDGGHERMYRVIEVELSFLFDFFYARCPSPKETLIPDTVVFAAVVATSLSTLFCSTLLNYHAPQGNMNVTTTLLDIWLTRMMVILFLILESFQYLTLVFSDWRKVKMLCRYVRVPSWQNHPISHTLLTLMCRVSLTRYWNNSVGQYSFLYSCLQSENSCIMRVTLPKLMNDFLRSEMTDHRNLPGTVKRAIYNFLKSRLPRIRYGEYTMAENHMGEDFLLALEQESTVHTILICHIATTICDLQCDKEPADRGTAENHEVATVLSDYCAYLMWSAPELLPHHSYKMQMLVEEVQRRARQCLQGCRSKNDVYDKFHNFELDSSPGAVILAQGRELGMRLVQRMPDATLRWKVLAEMWVDLLLSVAPSDNVTGHVKRLATGGELITHLWALLTHAGVVEKPINRHQRRGLPGQGVSAPNDQL